MKNPAAAILACFVVAFALPVHARYADGMNSYAAYHAMHGAVDPSGQVIVFVHGIKNFNESDIADVYDELKSVSVPTDYQSLIRFKYSLDGDEPSGLSAIRGLRSMHNAKAGAKLAELLQHLQQQRDELKQKYGEQCSEPIHLVGYSNGSNVIYKALVNYNIHVDSVTMLGASLDDRDSIWNNLADHSGVLYNFWSNGDWATEYVDGAGSDGLGEDVWRRQDVHDIHIRNVKHSIKEAKDSGYSLMNSGITDFVPHDEYLSSAHDATTWLTRHLAKRNYFSIWNGQGTLLLSRYGKLPGGTQLEPNESFYYHVDSTQGWGNGTINEGRD